MDIKTREAYSEISEILWLLGSKYIDKLPQELIEHIEKNKSKEYTPIYSYENHIDKLDLKDETRSILAFLHYSYWCDDEIKKEQVIKALKENDVKSEKLKNVVINELFPKEEKIVDRKNNIISKSENIQIVVKKESLFKRILNKIIMFFKK
jgi:hypothetical protein